MIISRIYNEFGECYDYCFEKNDSVLTIAYCQDASLKITLRPNEEKCLDFYITKDDFEVYEKFEEFYNRFVNCDVLEYATFNDKIRNSNIFKLLVDDKNVIHWISDEGINTGFNGFYITKEEDDFKLSFFTRNKSFVGNGVDVNVNVLDSNYSPFNCLFMRLYLDMQSIDPVIHQYSIEEIEYLKRKMN